MASIPISVGRAGLVRIVIVMATTVGDLRKRLGSAGTPPSPYAGKVRPPDGVLLDAPELRGRRLAPGRDVAKSPSRRIRKLTLEWLSPRVRGGEAAPAAHPTRHAAALLVIVAALPRTSRIAAGRPGRRSAARSDARTAPAPGQG